MESTTVMEVTTFKIKPDTDPVEFSKMDAQIERNFTSKQPGFIKRQSGVNEEGEYVVIVYWEKVADADASMNKFMNDTSVADYAQRIEAASMKMSRYTIDKAFKADHSHFVEVMSFDLKPATNLEQFNTLNQKVETDFTSKRDGFLQRLTGTDESGKQVVAVY